MISKHNKCNSNFFYSNAYDLFIKASIFKIESFIGIEKNLTKVDNNLPSLFIMENAEYYESILPNPNPLRDREYVKDEPSWHFCKFPFKYFFVFNFVTS